MWRAILVWCGVWLSLGSAQSAVVTASFEQVVDSRWTVDLAVTSDGSPAEISAFTVYFSRDRYADLGVEASPNDWDSIVVQPDPDLPDDGFFDSLLDAELLPLMDRETRGGFRVSFTLVGDAPDDLPFEIYEIDEEGSLATLFKGTTTTPAPSSVPEPSSAALAALALLAGWAGARVRRWRTPPQPRQLSGVTLLAAAVTCLPMAAAAVELKGTVMTSVVGAELLPGRFSSPLKDVQLYVGTLEQVSPGYPYRESYFAPLAVVATDDEGKYRVDLGDYPPRDIVVVLLLRSDDGAVSVFDYETDPDRPACLGSRVIAVNRTGTTQADLLLAVNPDNTSVYEFGSQIFQPTRDGEAPPVYGSQPRCAVDALGKPGQLLIPSPAYDGAGMTNTQPNRFAHLAAHYVRAYDAYEFVKHGLGKPSFAPVTVAAWYDNTLAYRYSCPSSSILLGKPRSPLFNPSSPSRIFAMRHEYGHHFMCASEMAGGVGQLPPRAAGDVNHGNLANSTSADSWSEGFASYFAAAVAEHHGEPRAEEQNTAGGLIDLGDPKVSVDDPYAMGENLYHGSYGEEFAVAGLLWDVSSALGSKVLLEVLERDTLDLVNFHRVYLQFNLEAITTGAIGALTGTSCAFPRTTAVAVGLDCLFIARGFYHDLNGDGLYGPLEEVGRTRWPTVNRSATVFRPEVPPLPGSTLRLRIVDGAGQPVAVEGFRVLIEHDPARAKPNSEYFVPLAGIGPHDLPILVPGGRARALVYPVSAGQDLAAPLVIEADFFHERVNPFRPGGVAPILVTHSFVVGATAGGLRVGTLQLVAEKRISRVVFEYTYRLEVLNDGPAVTALSAQVTTTDPNTTIVDGALQFGAVASNGRALSVDTFALRHDRRFPFNSAALGFKFAPVK